MVAGVGAGVVVLLVVWLAALVVVLVCGSRRPAAAVGVTGGAAVLTLVLLLLPHHTHPHHTLKQPPVIDHLFIPRVVLVLVLALSALAALAALTAHWAEPVLVKPLSRAIQASVARPEVYNITSEEEFKMKVMRSSVPVIVNFHADWCEPCHSLKPLLEKIAKENVGHLHLAEVLVDEHVDLLTAFEVTAVPAVLGINRGVVVQKFIGLVTHKEISTFVQKLMKDNI